MAACKIQKEDDTKKDKEKEKEKEREKKPCIPPKPVHLPKKQSINEATICPMCTKRLDSPKLLPCFHTLCLACLKRRCRGKTRGDFAKCPICHCKFVITDKGIDEIQSDFVAEFMLRAEDAPDKEKRSACESCPAEDDGLPLDIPPATSYCMDCLMKLCEGCSKPHSRLRGKHHRVLTLGKPIEQNHSCPPSTTSCDKHKDGMHHKFCFDCQANICELCCTCKFDKAKDMCKQISDTVTTFMQQLEDDIDIISGAISAIQAEITRLHREKLCFVEEVTKTEAAIVAKGDEVKKIVDTQVESVLEELARTKSHSLEKLHWAIRAANACVNSMRGFQNFGNLVKTEGTPYIISRVAEELNMHSRASFLLKWQQDIKENNYHTPKIVFEGADVESFVFTNGDKGSLIGKLQHITYMPGVYAAVIVVIIFCL